MRSAFLLYKKAREAGIDISHNQLKRGFYDHQEVVQQFAPLKKPDPSPVPITASFTGEKVYMDTMFFPKIAIINAFDLHSKYAWGKAIRLKKRADETTESVSSRKTANFFLEVEEDLHRKGFTPEEVITDYGTEFLGHFNRYLEEQGIPHTITEVGDHLQLGPIDGYTRGLRLSAEKWLAVNPGGDLYKQAPLLIEAYNRTEHSTIKMTPEEALTKIDVPIRKRVDERGPTGIKVGDMVRIAVRHDKNPFNKIRPNWSRDLYEVTKVNKATRRFTLDNGKTYQEKDIFHIQYPEKVGRAPPTKSEDTPSKPTPTPAPAPAPQSPRRGNRVRTKPVWTVDYV